MATCKNIDALAPSIRNPLIDRFWVKVKKGKPDECWAWLFGVDNNGYGQFSVNGRPVKAHRVAWMIVNGEIKNGLHCLHKCDNPICVNPSHLFLGTHAENMKDMTEKGRNFIPHGELCPLHKLTNEQVLEIRRLCKSGLTNKAIAKRFKIDKTHVYQIKAFRIWKHIGGERAKIQKPCNNEQKTLIRTLSKTGITQREIASIVGVTQAMVCYTINKAK